MSSSVQRLRRQIPLKKGDLIASTIIAIPVFLFITGFDIFMHDTFVLPTYHCDHAADAQKPECQAINERTTIQASIAGSTFQYEIQGRQQYWLWFGSVSAGLAFMPAFFRAFFGRSIKAGAMWFLTIFLPTYGGWEDFGYYALRGMEIPASLPWLNGHLLIAFVNGFIAPAGSDITSAGLYATMALVIVFLAGAWYLVLRKQR